MCHWCGVLLRVDNNCKHIRCTWLHTLKLLMQPLMNSLTVATCDEQFICCNLWWTVYLLQPVMNSLSFATCNEQFICCNFSLVNSYICVPEAAYSAYSHYVSSFRDAAPQPWASGGTPMAVAQHHPWGSILSPWILLIFCQNSNTFKLLQLTYLLTRFYSQIIILIKVIYIKKSDIIIKVICWS